MKQKQKPKKIRHILLGWIGQHDIALRIYISFVFVLAFALGLASFIFITLYQKNYIQSYTTLLTKQSKKISRRVSKFYQAGKESQFEKYTTYIDEIEAAENSDVWIISDQNSRQPLAEEYTNVTLDDTDVLTEEMNEVLQTAFSGNVGSNYSYDQVYGMVILRVAVPIVDRESKEVIGSVMMVSMLSRQKMGLLSGKKLIVMSAMMAIIVAYLVALLLTQGLSRPINRINRKIDRLAAGDYSPAKVHGGIGQIADVDRQLEYLATQLQKAEEERLNQEQVRRDFFANVSHELRTPLTVIRGYAETLNDGVLSDPDEINAVHQRILRECQQMGRLVEDLFILSKMQNPDFAIDCEPVSLAQILNEVTRSAKVMADEKNITLNLDIPKDDLCMVSGDYGRLRQLLLILLDNAVKFSGEDGDILLQITKKGQLFCVSVSDHGIGICKEELPFVFEKFYKSKMTQNEKGTGLGLVIAKHIVAKHGAELMVESKEQEGSRFYFELPQLILAKEDY